MEVEPESFNVQHDATVVHVPPPQAPAQLECITVKYTQPTRKCAWFPSCQEVAMECGGWKRTMCRNRQEIERMITYEQNVTDKYEARKERERRRSAERRRQRKRRAEGNEN